MIHTGGAAGHHFERFDPYRVPSPCYVIDEARVEENLEILHGIKQRSGARILLALKAFSMFALAPLVMRYLDGTCASGLWEARLGREEFGGEVHTFSAAYTPDDLDEVLGLTDHVVFNSLGQWRRYRDRVAAARQRRPGLEAGIRINPEHSEGENPLYDPCAPCSRLGVRAADLREADLDGIGGFHFHTLCDQLYDPLDRTLDAVTGGFGDLIGTARWINFGGGHLLTDPDYDIDALVARIEAISRRYGVQVYLEPGTAVVLQAGVLVTGVLDTGFNQVPQAIVDASATCHMPDVIEAPYRPEILGAGGESERVHSYQIGGPTCLAGDVFGRYSFDVPLKVGDRLVFEDQAPYTMVKNSTFNGIKLPSIAIWNSRTDQLKLVRRFGYEVFRDRLS